MFDIIDNFKSSIIQHGNCSRRIYVMEFPTENIDSFPQNLIQFAQKNQYTKIICKTPSTFEHLFIDKQFQKEAIIPGFFNEKDDSLFMCYYLDTKREVEFYVDKYKDVLELSKSKSDSVSHFALPSEYKVIKCSKETIPSLVDLYTQVFPSYPFPIHDPRYIQDTMEENITYYGILFKERLIAAASSERSLQYNNCEMTDFATLPKYRGLGLGCFLLHHMETKLQHEGISVVYTIARAISYGINITFGRNHYTFGGRLKNNTDIAGSIESMNIWYKRI